MAIFSSILSRAPVSSPTEIICTTMGGKTLASRSGAAIVSPSPIDSLIARMAFSITLLPAVRAVMSRAVRIGTPEVIIVPRVRVKRAMAERRRMLPRTGTRSSSPSIFSRPAGVR